MDEAMNLLSSPTRYPQCQRRNTVSTISIKEQAMKMDVNELSQRYAAGERNFSGVDLSFANLSQIDLREADLSRAVFIGANLERANLEFANLYGANLENADLTDACLFYANLRRAKLCNANLKGADLRSANLTDAKLTGADLSDADLWAANLPEGFTRSANGKIAQATSPASGNLQEVVRFRPLNRLKRIAQAFGKRKQPLRREHTEYRSWESEPPNGKLQAQFAWEQITLTSEETQRLQACIQEIAQILHAKTNLDEKTALEGIQNAFYYGLHYIGWL